MTIDLYDEAAPDVTRVLQAWIRPLGRTGTERLSTDPLPFFLLRRVTGSDDCLLGSDDAVMSIHVLASDMEQAVNESARLHQRLLYLVRNPFTDITVSGYGTANVEYCEVLEKPVYFDYANPDIYRFAGRYRVGVSFVQAIP